MWKLLRAALAAWKSPSGTAGSADRSPSAGSDSEVARPPTQADPEPPANADTGPGSLEERIRVQAYLLAESAGLPEGRDDEFWHRAEWEVREDEGQSP